MGVMPNRRRTGFIEGRARPISVSNSASSKVYESQILMIEQAVETAALVPGTNKSQGYCLEMVC
jgi:hypothetical protein